VESDSTFKPDKIVTANVEIALDRLMDLLKKARASEDGITTLDPEEDEVTLFAEGSELEKDSTEFGNVVDAGGAVDLSVDDIESMLADMDRDAPPLEQIRPLDGAGNLISRIIFNTVTTLYVGEKIMIQMPTWFFPGGAGAYSEGAKFISHGEPTPLATFRFAEPIYIDKQQNFRVEIEVPDKDELAEIQKIYGPFNMWVVLDGYMVRDVQ